MRTFTSYPLLVLDIYCTFPNSIPQAISHLRTDVRREASVQIQLFARSQGQYLFPNSSLAPGKRVAGGLRLCAWWKGVYESVAARVVVDGSKGDRVKDLSVNEETGTAQNGSTHDPNGMRVESSKQPITLRYLLPSYSAEEAKGMLGASKMTLPDGLGWMYGPPFASTPNGQSPTLAMVIPSLPDDPKTRFLDELVSELTPTVPHDRASRSETKVNGDHGRSKGDRAPLEVGALPMADLATADTASSHAELSSNALCTSAEGPGLTSSGVTLVESLNGSPKKKQTKHLGATTLAQREKERQMDEADRKAAEGALSRISPDEFWERMGFRQECASGDVTGFFTLESSVTSSSPTKEKQSTSRELDRKSSSPILTDEDGPDGLAIAPPTSGSRPSPNVLLSSSMDLPNELVDRILTSLLNCDFASQSLAIESTKIWSRGAKGIVIGEIGESGWETCIASISKKEGLDTGLTVKRKEEEELVVTMLQPRKKKRA
ncbi:histone acetylation protein-domain-containing protein [Kockovaella imperatae]|uniref:histone acetyltransferase n=1 Tax=Kockovaella imperatae TaxID=4999 RepID=A0A1Y1UCJ8_9TREE|nr:histone acetylation protein-domain-containing protein [Kockovaella imperatae]ORX35244.1 histone acetylation protein-domain-containing protein [Kockovaella imperatae]